MSFKRIFSLDIKGTIVAVGIGNPGRGNSALYEHYKQRIILEKALLKNPEQMKRVLRHEMFHVVFYQIEEDFAERIEDAGSKSDAALSTYLLEHP
jgi:Leu/Phe-tRNA-protein transferase